MARQGHDYDEVCEQSAADTPGPRLCGASALHKWRAVHLELMTTKQVTCEWGSEPQKLLRRAPAPAVLHLASGSLPELCIARG